MCLSLLLVACSRGENKPGVALVSETKNSEAVESTNLLETVANTNSTLETKPSENSVQVSANDVEQIVNLKNDVFKIEVKDLNFKLSIPKTWTIKAVKATQLDKQLLSDGAGRHEVYDSDNKLMFVFAYLPYDEAEAKQGNLQAIYNQVALGNNNRFMLRGEPEEKVAELEQSDEYEKLLCQHYSLQMPKKTEVIRQAALVRFKSEKLYLAVIKDEAMSEAAFKEMVQSIKLAK